MIVRYIGNPGDGKDQRRDCDMFGRTFLIGIEQDVSELDDHAKGKLAGNSHFEVMGAPEKRKPGRPRKEEAGGEAQD